MNIDNKNEEREIIKAAKKQNKRLLSEKIKEERKKVFYNFGNNFSKVSIFIIKWSVIILVCFIVILSTLD
tara:strand:+ start:305 stop:514 length:210 start_codon:yes stop_codon:yes gene_type:complete